MLDENRVVFLRSSRVILRPLMKSDLPSVLRWINDPEVRYYLESYLPMAEAEEEEWISGLGKRKPNNVVLAIETAEGIHIGSIGLHNIRWRDRVATTGAMIGEKDYRNKGYGTDAKMLLLHYAFDTLNLRKICSQVIDYNTPSLAYSMKCGYKREGELKDQIFKDGQYRNIIELAAFREDFMPLWEVWKKQQE